MEINRRTVLGLMAGAACWTPGPRGLVARVAKRLYLSARADGAGGYRVSAFDRDGDPRLDLPLPGRGHSFALHPRRPVAVCFARRPGTFARVVDFDLGAVTKDFNAPANRHFQGHGVYARDGRLLYGTENDFANNQGVIGVYDTADDYRRVGELPSHGIGPHQLGLLSDGDTLVVANGGIATHPDSPGVKLNIPTMAPSLVYLNRRDGRLLDKARLAPELHRLGIRHLSVAGDGRVAIAMQYEGPVGDRVPLVGLHQRGQKVVLLDAPGLVLRAMNQYCASVAFDISGHIIAVTSPRGNVITLWSTERYRHLRSVSLPDCSGVAPTGRRGQFLASSGGGGATILNAAKGIQETFNSEFVAGGLWDNHMVVASPDRY